MCERARKDKTQAPPSDDLSDDAIEALIGRARQVATDTMAGELAGLRDQVTRLELELAELRGELRAARPSSPSWWRTRSPGRDDRVM